MSTPAAIVEDKPMKWHEPFIGFLFALLVLGGLGIAGAVSYDGDSADESTHTEDSDH